MRLFLGLPVEGRAFEEVGEKVGLIKGNGWQVKWSKPENLNLTMAFIGEVDDVGVIRVLENMVRQNPIPKKMILEFEGFGVFNNYSQPRVLTLAIGKSEKLFEYRNGLIESLRENSVYYDGKSFKPHITLGRVKNTASREEKSEIGGQLEKQAKFDAAVNWHPERLVLYQSVLSTEGVVYREIVSSS